LIAADTNATTWHSDRIEVSIDHTKAREDRCMDFDKSLRVEELAEGFSQLGSTNEILDGCRGEALGVHRR
jgi:hypothetical protein